MSSIATLNNLVDRLNSRLALTEVTVPPAGAPSSSASLVPGQGGAVLPGNGRLAAGNGVNDAVNGLVTQWIVCVRDLLSVQDECLTLLKEEVFILSQPCASTSSADAVTSPLVAEGAISAVIALPWAALLSMLQELCLSFQDAANAALDVTDFDFAIYQTAAQAAAGTFDQTDAGILVLINNGATELVGGAQIFKVAALGFLGADAATPTSVWGKYRPNATAGNVDSKVIIIIKSYEIRNCVPVT